MACISTNGCEDNKTNRHLTAKENIHKIKDESEKKSLNHSDIFEKMKELVKRCENLDLQGCYLDGERVVVDITTGTEEAVKSLIQTEIGNLEHIRLHEYEESPKYVSSRGEDKVESGSFILKMEPDDAEKYHQFHSEEILEGKSKATLGYFATDNKSKKKYILTAMHFISEEQGKQAGTRHIYAKTTSDGNLYAVSEKFFGWLGSYDISESIKDKFIDIVALELKDDAPLSKIDFAYKDEKSQSVMLMVPDHLSEGCQVQKWGENTGITFGEIENTDYTATNGSGQILIKCLHRRVIDFALHGDSGALVTDVLEPTKFNQDCINSCASSNSPNAYGLVSSTRSGEGISYASNLQFGLRMLQKEFDLDLEFHPNESG